MRILHVGLGFRPLLHGGLIAYAEDLMAEQVARGDEVHYFCTGRHYPLVGRRVLRRRVGGVHRIELLNSPVLMGPVERGTRRPDLEVREPGVERVFADVLREVRPDVVHVQELGGMPSSVVDLAADAGVPVLMTLQDYFPLCPTVKLYDADGALCRRTDPAPMCVRCCREAPGRAEAVVATLGFHRAQLGRRAPFLARVPGPRTLARRLRERRAGDPVATEQAQAGPVPGPDPGAEAAFRARREVNVARLNRIDRLVPMSGRVAELYAELGVDTARMRPMRLTLAHHERLRGRRIERVDGPVRFVTLNGCATPAKGAHVVADAVTRLAAQGFTSADLTLSVGGTADPAVADRLAASGLVEVLGGYDAAELQALLRGCHVGIVPSVWEEAFGYVGIELLAQGLPVIGNALGGIPEYVRDGETGWRNTTCDGAGLAGIMARIVRDPSQVVALNERILALRDELVLPLRVHADELAGVYAELVAQSSSTAVPRG